MVPQWRQALARPPLAKAPKAQANEAMVIADAAVMAALAIAYGRASTTVPAKEGHMTPTGKTPEQEQKVPGAPRTPGLVKVLNPNFLRAALWAFGPVCSPLRN